MISKLALLSNLFLASVTLAVPSSQLADRLARRHEGHQPQRPRDIEEPSNDASDSSYSLNWAGAVLKGDSGTFTTVTGIFTVPASSSGNGAASFFVGIDGNTCITAAFQTGVELLIRNKVVSYNAWYRWYPDSIHYFSGFSVSAGHVISATVLASSTTSGTVVLENLTTGQTAIKTFDSLTPLCGWDAEWIVEGGALIPFADYDTVTFSGAIASGELGTYTPSGARITNIKQNDRVLTSVSTSGDTITVQYV